MSLTVYGLEGSHPLTLNLEVGMGDTTQILINYTDLIRELEKRIFLQ